MNDRVTSPNRPRNKIYRTQKLKNHQKTVTHSEFPSRPSVRPSEKNRHCFLKKMNIVKSSSDGLDRRISPDRGGVVGTKLHNSFLKTSYEQQDVLRKFSAYQIRHKSTSRPYLGLFSVPNRHKKT